MTKDQKPEWEKQSFEAGYKQGMEDSIKAIKLLDDGCEETWTSQGWRLALEAAEQMLQKLNKSK